jgi:glycosyltransferase involved in cell wall biosynthesis
VIHPPVRTRWLRQAPREVGLQDRDYLLGVGRWVGYKNVDFMIDVAAEARMPLVLAGGGPGEATLRRRAAQSGADVRFEVRPSDERVRELMYGARALLFPCHEDFGITPVEAQACGTPVIGLRAGGLLETVVDGETGFLVDRLDPAAFATMANRVDRLSPQAAQRNATRFSAERFAAELLRWIEEESAQARAS